MIHSDRIGEKYILNINNWDIESEEDGVDKNLNNVEEALEEERHSSRGHGWDVEEGLLTILLKFSCSI